MNCSGGRDDVDFSAGHSLESEIDISFDSGVDLFGSSNNIILGCQADEELQLSSLASVALSQITVNGRAVLAGRFIGATHSTYVILDTPADGPAAQTALTALFHNDLFVDGGLIA